MKQVRFWPSPFFHTVVMALVTAIVKWLTLITILSISKRNGPQPPPSHIKPISIYVWKRISIRRKKSKEVSQIPWLSKGKRGRNLVSTVALDHVCVHVWRRNARQCTCACICPCQGMCMWKKPQPELVENIQPSPWKRAFFSTRPYSSRVHKYMP